MSVIVYEYDEFEGVAITLSKIKALEPVVMSNSYVKEYNSRQMPESFKYTMESVIGRLLWYMYVANRVAYSLQYQENLKIFEDELPAKKFTDTEAADKFGSFMYNIYTNNGTVFLSKEWLGLAEDISEALKFLNITSRYAKGGLVDTNGNKFTTKHKVVNEIIDKVKPIAYSGTDSGGGFEHDFFLLPNGSVLSFHYATGGMFISDKNKYTVSDFTEPDDEYGYENKISKDFIEEEDIELTKHELVEPYDEWGYDEEGDSDFDTWKVSANEILKRIKKVQ